MRDADSSLALEPDLLEAYLNLGTGLIGMAQYQEALLPLEKAISLITGSKLELAYFNRAIAREHLGDITGAYHDYKAVTELDPKYQAAAVQLSRFKVI